MIAELLFIKSSIVLGTAALAAGAVRRRSAATRAAVWAAAFGVLLAIPLLEPALPDWRPIADAQRPDPFARVAPAATPDASAVPVRRGGEHTMDHTADAPPRTADDAPPVWQLWLRRAAPWLVGLWAAGLAVALLRFIVAHARVRGIVRRGVPADGDLASAAHHAAARLGLTGRWRVLLSSELDSPVQAGVRNAAVILPGDAAEWPCARRDAVLLHELAHVARRDCLLRAALELVRAVYWPQPLVHWAARHALLALEQAADDAVLRSGHTRPAYAEHLAAIATLPLPAGAGAALAMARPSTLVPRVRAILDPAAERGAMGRRALIVTGLLAAAGAVSVGAVTIVGEGTDGLHASRARAALTSAAPAERLDAVLTVGRLHDAGSANAVALLLADADPEIRGMAAWALGRMRATRHAPALVTALRDTDPVVRELALLALGTIGDARWVPAMAALTRDAVWEVRAIATEALSNVGGEAAGAALREMLARETEPHTRSMAVWALQQTRSSHSVPGLIALLSDSAMDVRTTAVMALADYGDPRALDPLVDRLLHDPLPPVRGRAAQGLGQLGDARAVAPLSRALGDPDWRVRMVVTNALAEFPSAETARLIAPVLRDSVHQVRLTAAQALDRIASR